MSIENKVSGFMRNSGPARFFVPVGLILIIVGCVLFGFKSDNYEKATGTVTSVETVTDMDNNKSTEVHFTYTVDGLPYEGSFDVAKEYSKGDSIDIYYNPEDPKQYTNAKTPGFLPFILIGAGALALVFGIFRTVQAFKKSKQLNEVTAGKTEEIKAAFAGFKESPEVTEYYFRYDGNTLKPGYILEDADRKILFEGKMLKNALVGARTFEFTDHVTGSVKEHEVGHTMTQTFDNEGFSNTSWFKFDGENVWDLIHSRGVRLETDILSKFPKMGYEASKDGKAWARIETSSKYVHEDEEAEHKITIPYGKMYYRIWTASDDFETLFLTVFAITECEQTVVE